jgi:stage III sporulation protein AB
VVFKLSGALLTVLACGWVGLIVAKNYRNRPWELRYLGSALQMLETEIVYASTPLPEALKKIAERVEFPVAFLFEVASTTLKTGEGGTADEAWITAVNKFMQVSSLIKIDLDILISFGHSLGASDKSEQVKILQLTREQLKHQEISAEAERMKNEQIWRLFGFLIGLVIVFLVF